MSVTSAAAVITASIAVLIAIITWREWITNRSRLRHELFERRYAIYEEIAGFIATILQQGKIPDGEPLGFSRRTKKAYFVFGCDNDIKKLCDDIYRNAVDLHVLGNLDSLSPEQRKENVEKQRKVQEWFINTLNSMGSRFEKYLMLKH